MAIRCLIRIRNVSLYSEHMNAKTYSPLTRYQSAFGDDQTSATLDALHIIFLHDLAWVRVWGAIPGERGHHESILQGVTPNLERSEESFCGHFECIRKQVLTERENWTWLASIAINPCFYIGSAIIGDWRIRVIWTASLVFVSRGCCQ